MTTEEKNTLLETVDILRALGGQNGFSNLQPKVKKMLLKYAHEIKDIVERDIQKKAHIVETVEEPKITHAYTEPKDREDLEMTY